MAVGTFTRQIAAGLSETLTTAAAAHDAARQAAEQIHGEVDLAVLLLSPHHYAEAHEAVAAVEAELAPRELLGCVAQGVVAHERELESTPGVAIWAASLPGAEVQTFHTSAL